MTKETDKNEVNNINLRSEEVKEILGRPPRWMIRWGITVVFIIIAFLVIGSWFFRYPEVVTSKISLTTENPPSPIVARTSGKIEYLFVQDKEIVKQGQPLAVIEDAANYQDVIRLEEKLKYFKSVFSGNALKKTEFNTDLTLGNIQSYYASFLKRMEEFENFRLLDYYQKRIKSLKEEKQKYETYYQGLQTQKEISKKEYKLAYKKYRRDSVLFEKEVIPEAQHEKSETQLLQKKYTLEQNQVTLSNARIQLSKIEQNILALQLEKEQQQNQLESNLMEAYDNLKGAIDSWKKQYYLVSPVQGRVSFTNYWSKNQFVQHGKRVMTIVPEKEGELIGKMKLGFQGAGKVKKGQTVHIKFRNYPYLEYGMVKGIVRKISEVPEDNVYMVEVDLPKGLTTFYGEQLEFHQQMMGEAEIITQDIRLLEKIVRPLRYVIHKNLKEN